MKLVSTTQLAKELGLDAKDLFQKFNEIGWIYKKDSKWNLTREGKIAGGETKYNPNYGEYVVWPIGLDLNKPVDVNQTINVTTIGKKFNLSPQHMNSILHELGWIDNSSIGGWELTIYGKRVGGHQMESRNGSPYVIWDENILQNKNLLTSIQAATGEIYQTETHEDSHLTETDVFRKKFEAKYRTQDGHRVRSRAEAIIDNFLYTSGIAHAYERRLPGIDEEVLSDFYIPSRNVYVEFWGLEEEKYQDRKRKKLSIYAKYKFNLIELNDRDLESLDDTFPRKLKKFGVNII